MDPRFGRCAYLVLVQPSDMRDESILNVNGALGEGAGIQSARLVAERGVKVVLIGKVGPNAHQARSAAGIEVVVGCSGTVAETVERFKSGEVRPPTSPTVAGHTGIEPLGVSLRAKRDRRKGGPRDVAGDLARRIARVGSLTSREPDQFSDTGDVAQDLLAIAAVHPLREVAVAELLRKAGADRSVLDGLVEQRHLVQVDYEGERFYRSAPPSGQHDR